MKNIPASRKNLYKKTPTKDKKPTGKTFTTMGDQPTRAMLGIKKKK